LIFGVSAIVVFTLGKFRVPSIVGFLVAGMVLGPHGFQFIKDIREIELLAEIGVILLMFTIGLEFSLRNLMMLRYQVFGAGIIHIEQIRKDHYSALRSVQLPRKHLAEDLINAINTLNQRDFS